MKTEVDGEDEEREFNLLVLLEQEQNCGYVARKLYTQAISLEELANSIRRAFSLEHPIQLSYFDTEFQSYVVPNQFSELPSKGKIKVRDARRRRPTEEDIQQFLDIKLAEPQLAIKKPTNKLKDSSLNSDELYHMLWTLLIVIANNLPEEQASNKPKRTSTSAKMKSFNSFEARRKRARTMTTNKKKLENPTEAVEDFCCLVYSLANIFPDINTRLVLRNVLQDYDVIERVHQIRTATHAKDWIRLIFARVNEALQNTFDGEFNQHIISSQDEMTEFQASWFPITETNPTEYKLQVNVKNRKKKKTLKSSICNLMPSTMDLNMFKSIISNISDTDPANIRGRTSSFSFLDGEKDSTMASIPDELIIHIFSFLDVFQLYSVHSVCRRWKVLSSEGFLWKRKFESIWKLRIDWMKNWDVLVMYSNDNWMQAFTQWYYWELINTLLNQEDSDYNIIYEEKHDEDDDNDSSFEDPSLFPNEQPSLLDRIISHGGGEDDIDRNDPDAIIQPYHSTSQPSVSLIAPIPVPHQSQSQPQPQAQSQQGSQNGGWVRVHRRSQSASKMSTTIGRLLPKKQEEPVKVQQQLISVSEARYQKRTQKISLSLIAEVAYNESSILLPDLGLLLPPCLTPQNPQEMLDIPPPIFLKSPPKLPIKRATLMKLVEYLTTPYSHDLQYMKVFMLTYIYFTTPQSLLKILIRRYFIFPSNTINSEELQQWEERVKTPIRLRVFNILKFWLENYEMDFGQHLLSCLKEFAQKELPPIMSKQILKVIRLKQRTPNDKPKTVSDFQFNAAPPYPEVPKNIFSQTLQIWDIPVLEIARQLTIIEFNLFAAIRPRELLNQSWKHPKKKKVSPNIIKMLVRFQELSGKWIPNLIEHAPHVKQKVKVLKKLILIALELMKLNNFHDAMAVLQGIKVNCEIRFPGIWANLTSKYKKDFRAMELIMSTEEQYKTNLPSRHPCIPYLDYHLKKLVAVETVVPSSVGHMVNFAKCRYVYKVVSQLIRYQQTPYNLQPVTQISVLLCNFSDLDNLEDQPNFEVP